MGHYSRESFDRAVEAFSSRDYPLALVECRRHVTWYVLSHRAHTLPLLQTGKAAGRRMLYVDVRALSEIVAILMRCTQRAGEGSGFPLVLDQLAHAIDTSLWRDKIAYFRSLWCLVGEGDRTAAIRELSAIDLDDCQDTEILQLHLDLSAATLSFAERIRLVDRVLASAEKASEKLQYTLVKATYYALIGEEPDAIALVREGIERYRALDSSNHSRYGDMFLAESLSLLGRLADDPGSIRQAACVYERLVAECLESDNCDGSYLASLEKSVGDCCLSLDEFEAAASHYEKSLAIESTELTKLFLARALIGLQELDRARSLLKRIVVTVFDDYCMLDRALFACDLALHSRNADDRLEAIALLKSSSATHPLFEKYRQDALLALMELRPDTSPGKLTGALRRLTRYLSLNPNFLGLGVNLNRVIEDISRSREGGESES